MGEERPVRGSGFHQMRNSIVLVQAGSQGSGEKLSDSKSVSKAVTSRFAEKFKVGSADRGCQGYLERSP